MFYLKLSTTRENNISIPHTPNIHLHEALAKERLGTKPSILRHGSFFYSYPEQAVCKPFNLTGGHRYVKDTTDIAKRQNSPGKVVCAIQCK